MDAERATRDAAAAAIAEAIRARLGALGLYARVDVWRNGFVEVVGSTSPRFITTPDGREASGVAVLLAPRYAPPTLVFEEINSLTPGLGRRMAGAALAPLAEGPGVICCIRVDDASPRRADGRSFWEHVAAEHPQFEWRITPASPPLRHARAKRGPLATLRLRLCALIRRALRRRRPAAGRSVAETRRRIEIFARDFGYDPEKVRLLPQKPAFDFLGQSFVSEGEAFPDGRIHIYYDPRMSAARLGCCLAHEIQHARFFAVAAAFRAEGDDGPLHRRFAQFTPQRIAALGGVSDYSSEHWRAWRSAGPPRLFSRELEEGGSEPINETLADAAKALFNWGSAAKLHPDWRELLELIRSEYEKLPLRPG
jgi:hypothetical protein